MVALPALVSGLDAELVRLGYKDSTMVWYRGAWRRLQRYFAARGAEEFSLDMAMVWVDEACGFFAKEQAGTLKQTDVYLFRVAQMLGEYEAHGAVLRRYSCTVSKLAGDEAAAVARFEVEGPAVSGLRKLCFLSRYLQCQELVADLLRRPVPVCRVKTFPIVTQFDVARNITHGLFAGRIDCAVHELFLEGGKE